MQKRKFVQGMAGVVRARRGVVVAGAGALAAGVIAACGASSGSQSGAAGGASRVLLGTAITYLAFHNAQELQFVQGQMQRWEQRQSGAKVEITNLPQAEMFAKLATMMAAGMPPDLIRSGGTQWAQYANQGGFAEIDTRIKRDKYDLADFSEAAV